MEKPIICNTSIEKDVLTDLPENRIITVKNVSFRYLDNGVFGVKSINCAIDKGKVVVIVGASGSGKSTLLKLIYGLMPPDDGMVYFKSEAIIGPERKLIPGHDSMKMVTQDFSLNTYAKVYDNIASMLPNTNLKYKAEKTEEMLELLRIKHLAQKRVSDLSGGEQQRVAIARAIVTEPEVLLMDEPFSQIDTVLKNHLRADIRRLSKELGITVILISHDPLDGLSLADELIVMRGGALVENGHPKQLYSHPRNPYTAQLLTDCNILNVEHVGMFGIESDEDIAIYPQDIELGDTGFEFMVKQVFFKGFYDELVLMKDDIQLRAYHFKTGKILENSLVKISVKEYRSIGK